MKSFMFLVLVMLMVFSMEKKIRSRSKGKRMNAWYLNRPIYLKSAHGDYLSVDRKYRLSISDGRDVTWKIVPTKNDKYLVISSMGNNLCTNSINIPITCSNQSGSSEWSISAMGTNTHGLRNKNGKYLTAGKLGIIKSLRTSNNLQDWETWTVVKP